jgi:hypothetical protein
MIGYALMSDKELGINIYIKEDKGDKYIIFKGEDKTREEKLYLEERSIVFQRVIICRRIICYRVKKQNSKCWEFMIKFSWRSDKRRAEEDFLKLIKERNV